MDRRNDATSASASTAHYDDFIDGQDRRCCLVEFDMARDRLPHLRGAQLARWADRWAVKLRAELSK